MEFTPRGTIYLCTVDFDNSYKNVVYFSNRDAQKNYFDERMIEGGAIVTLTVIDDD